MKIFRTRSLYTPSLFTLLLICVAASPGLAWHDPALDRVSEASATFVESFNAQKSAELGDLYTKKATLKLPNSQAVNGRSNIVAAWQGGFDNGLGALALSVESLQRIKKRRVLESGTYALTINTPDGPIVQVGTYAVLWHVPQNPDRTPRIIFDTIDAD